MRKTRPTGTPASPSLQRAATLREFVEPACSGDAVGVTGPRRALVVGASSAIGRAVAIDLAPQGHRLVLWGRDQARLDETASSCRAVRAVCSTELVDATDRAATADAVARLRAGGALSVVVYAAGVFDGAPADQAHPEAWARVLDTNLTAAAVLTALVLPQLIEAAPSALVYIGSGAGRRVYANNAAYIASKHGLAGLAGATFLDVRDRGVKVSVVSPGLVAAGAGLLSEAGTNRPDTLLTPDDVAAAVRFVVTFPTTGCPIEIDLQLQQTP